eukprot:1028387-Amorphochlora_amoeboformis.AAC.1
MNPSVTPPEFGPQGAMWGWRRGYGFPGAGHYGAKHKYNVVSAMYMCKGGIPFRVPLRGGRGRVGFGELAIRIFSRRGCSFKF